MVAYGKLIEIERLIDQLIDISIKIEKLNSDLNSYHAYNYGEEMIDQMKFLKTKCINLRQKIRTLLQE